MILQDRTPGCQPRYTSAIPPGRNSNLPARVPNIYRRMRFILCAVAILALAAACSDDDEATVDPTSTPGPTPTPAASSGPIGFETLVSGTSSGVLSETPVVRTATTQAEWETLWSEHQAIVSSPDDPPEVDFTSQMVIAVFDQERPTGGYSIEIQNITAGEGATNVFTERTWPGRGCTVTQAFTKPFHIVVADRLDSAPALSISETVTDCE